MDLKGKSNVGLGLGAQDLVAGLPLAKVGSKAPQGADHRRDDLHSQVHFGICRLPRQGKAQGRGRLFFRSAHCKEYMRRGVVAGSTGRTSGYGDAKLGEHEEGRLAIDT